MTGRLRIVGRPTRYLILLMFFLVALALVVAKPLWTPAELPLKIRLSPMVLPAFPLAERLPDEIILRQLGTEAMFPVYDHKYAVHDMLHGLRAWGPRFEHRDCLGSAEMLRTLTDDQVHHSYYYATSPGPSLLIPTATGFTVRVVGGRDHIGTASHDDKFLQVMGELGLPSDLNIRVAGRHLTLADGIRDATARFDLGQEVEFTTVAFALYLPPTRSWTNRFGQRFTFDDLARRLINLRSGACQNIHRLYAIAILLRVQRMEPVLSPDVAVELERALLTASSTLVARQRPDGLWDANWESNREASSGGSNVVLDAITATGHHLEWMAMAAPSLRVPDEHLSRAIEGLARCMAATSGSFLAMHRGPVTHAFRGCCLLAGVEPTNLFKADSTPTTSERIE